LARPRRVRAAPRRPRALASALFPYTTLFRSSYIYQVYAINDTLRSGYSNAAAISTPPAPAAPTNLAATLLGSLTVGPSVRLSFQDRKSTRLNSSHVKISYAVFCLKKKNA